MADFLLVDDDEAFTHVLSRALSRKGFDCVVACNVKDAQTLAAKQSFSHAILDLKMTGASGLVLIPILTQLQPAIKIVMLTGYSSVATAVEAVKLGATNYLCKPVTTDEILAAFNDSNIDSDIAIPANRPSIDRLEWEHIQKVLIENNDNVSATARALGMHRRTLQRKLNKRPVKH